jgi:hypothetical protein
MKKLAMNTVVIMVTIAAISAGALTLNLDQYTGFNGVQKSGALMVTNVEAVMKDEAGNIVAYRQGDNHIVGSGMVILAQQTFGPGVGGSPASNNTNSTTAPHTLSAQVRYMEIGNGNGTGACPGAAGSPILGWDNTTLECPIATCNRVAAIIYRHDPTNDGPGGSGPTSHAQLNVTAIATFAGSAGCNGNSIDEAGIWMNSTQNGAPSYATAPAPVDNRMFARNTFGSVNLSTSDSLELTWRFTFTDS